MIKIIKGDLTKMHVDAIVNAANTSLLGGRGVDGAIHNAAGPRLLEACRIIQGNPRCPTGEAKITPGFNLPAKFVIHTVGPVYTNGNADETALLYKAYYNSLSLASENRIRSIAFPAISTGVYKYPIEAAAKIAFKAVQSFIQYNPSAFERIIFVLFNESAFKMYDTLIQLS